jgi:hypothetical protein
MDECPICMENLQFKRRKIHTTACNHKFHTMCFKKVRGVTCPCCRASIIPGVDIVIRKTQGIIKEINAEYVLNKKKGKAEILKLKKELSLLKKIQKEIIRDLKKGVIEDTLSVIFGLKKHQIEINKRILDCVRSIIFYETQFPVMVKFFEGLLFEKHAILFEAKKAKSSVC